MSQDPDPQSFESIDEQSRERTKAVEDDPATHEVQLAVLPKASNPSTCVPKPRPPTPSDTSFQRAEFVKNMQAYLASQGPRVKAPPVRTIV